MPDSDLLHIKISRIIPAPKDNVIRFVTQVEEFPLYIPTVKEVKIIERKHNIMKTKWLVQVDSVPISWTEEDTLALRDGSIHFKAIEGDLDEFYGDWKFNNNHNGTEVVVDVYLKVGIPAIREFAEPYIEKLLTKNFEAMLSAIESRLISLKYAQFRKGEIVKLAGFGVLGHFYNYNHLVKCLQMVRPDFRVPSREFLSRLFTMTPSFAMHEMQEFKSKTGEATRGCFILCTFIPEMLDQDIHAVYSKVVRACRVAQRHGVGVVSLGGFTSIVGERLGREISEDVDIPITTGNTYTAALTIDGIEKAVELLGKDLKDLKLAVIGGTGDIGSACSRVLTDKVKEIIITGRTKSHLCRLRDELRKKRHARIEATTDNKKAVSGADIVIASASVAAAILDTAWFKPGAVICDLGYPKNISYAPINRKDILVFSGGLARLPTPINTGVDMGLPSPDVSYGCFCEAIILSLEKRYENFSFGRGNITCEKIDEIRQSGAKHGFTLAPFYWANRLISQEDFAEVRKTAARA